ncbi:chorismate mutase [Natroniella sulfidigena]|uniref:chorismate mutase n=1 Tax=Natroniella sulfidigena TaxID=723921 RepID=UPI00200ADF76|nr:chorismate mutase [Natroniella sulfidigena]MCK8816919.1 chorismate mutase [Natroniella sulfidigena]
MKVRGVRGATTVKENTEEDILEATRELLQEMIKDNEIKEEDIASIFFSMTSELDQAFPAVAAREIGLTDTPLLCTKELEIEGALKKCIRILIHYNTSKELTEINHIYLREAESLRLDLVEGGE